MRRSEFAQKRAKDSPKFLQPNSQLLSGTLVPLFLVAAQLKMVFQKKGSFFCQGH